METLKLGSKGEAVKILQKLLNLPVDGIFSKDTESAVKLFQKNNNLVVDGIVGNNTWNVLQKNDLNIVYKPINVNITKLERKIKYLVIHYTAGSSSKEGAAMRNRDVFTKRNASADFIVDDATIIQVNPDLNKYYCWAIGDGKGKKGIYNKDCISIEMCSTLDKGTSAAMPNHKGWHITDSVLSKTIALSKYLIKKYNIKLENVIRHYDATDKCCPGILGWNNCTIYDSITGKPTKDKNNSSEWIKFKKALED